MDIEKISNLIKIKRKEKKLTQEELAQKINVTEKAVSRWETGRGTPDISLLIPLANTLGIDVSELLSGIENKKDLNNSIVKIIEYEENSKKHRNKTPIIISALLYLIFIFLYLLYLKNTYSTIQHVSYLGHIIFNSIFALLISIANWNLYSNYFDKEIDKEKMKKITYASLLFLYTIMILNVTVFERNFNFESKWQGLDNYFKYGGFNIVPFKTIIEYFTDFGRFWPRYFIVNVIGNIVVFMPIQYLMIKIFGKQSFQRYLIINIIILLIIESMQLITGAGAFDIDDILLNLLGMFSIYFLYIKFEKVFKKE